jgi:hypothetical protein
VTEGVDWICLVQDREQWWVFAQCNETSSFNEMTINSRVPEELFAYQEGLRFLELVKCFLILNTGNFKSLHVRCCHKVSHCSCKNVFVSN